MRNRSSLWNSPPKSPEGVVGGRRGPGYPRQNATLPTWHVWGRPSLGFASTPLHRHHITTVACPIAIDRYLWYQVTRILHQATNHGRLIGAEFELGCDSTVWAIQSILVSTDDQLFRQLDQRENAMPDQFGAFVIYLHCLYTVFRPSPTRGTFPQISLGSSDPSSLPVASFLLLLLHTETTLLLVSIARRGPSLGLGHCAGHLNSSLNKNRIPRAAPVSGCHGSLLDREHGLAVQQRKQLRTRLRLLFVVVVGAALRVVAVGPWLR